MALTESSAYWFSMGDSPHSPRGLPPKPTTYHHPIYLLEAFVEKNRFQATCYRAANWICVGQTRGPAKKGHDHLFHGSIKDVYLYPLIKRFRMELCRGSINSVGG
ncbi:MAG: hypothetical protein ABIJ52_12930 [Pseudomonadota bacterium]|nr:DUF4338 domain-containing protein [Pseudomonadota bacterium]